MPVYRFKNVDKKKLDELERLINLFLGAHSTDPAVTAVTDHIFNAHECSLIEMVANSFEIHRLLNPDPAILKQINDIIATCK